MRLSKIKLAGFKSFVDPTTLNLPGNLTGIVGPNGCGKSNTIDAVRWVMGESSAKHLRGESMDDVIFSGSSARKPVGQASVELVFDNSAGKLGGQYAQFTEISVKRQVTRDGQSQYFLNAARCRRRDITDIFLGTGLGPRSYAIIEQGMISRLIEARPEDMRVYIEEAAGISRYKERRRETENRIRHTRDNLDRLNDLREEVDKQLAHLQRQSKMAERYKTLKVEEKQLRAELLGLRWQEYQDALGSFDKRLAERNEAVEVAEAGHAEAEQAIENMRTARGEMDAGMNRIQASYYQLGADITRIEQTIEHQRSQREARERDIARVIQELAEAEQNIVADRNTLAEIERGLADAGPARARYDEAFKSISEVCDKAESDFQQWREDREQLGAEQTEQAKLHQIEAARASQLEKNIGEASLRRERLQRELADLEDADLAHSLAELTEERDGLAAQETQLRDALQRAGQALHESRERESGNARELDECRTQLQSASGRLASLEALQQAALGGAEKNRLQWLEQHGLTEAPQLARMLSIDAGWEKAAEVVLGDFLEAVCVDDMDTLRSKLAGQPESGIKAVQNNADEDDADQQPWLASVVSSTAGIAELLHGITVCESLEEAMQAREQLQPGESLVTRDGVWMGRHWLCVRPQENGGGVLARQEELDALKTQSERLRDRVDTLESQHQDLEAAVVDCEQQRDKLQAVINARHRDISTLNGKIESTESQIRQSDARTLAVRKELDEVTTSVRRVTVELDEARSLAAEAGEQSAELDQQIESQEVSRAALLARRDQARAKLEEVRQDSQQALVKLESMKSVRESTANNLQRMEQQRAQLLVRQEELGIGEDAEDDETETLAAQQEELQQARDEVERELAQARRSLEQHDEALRQRDRDRSRLQQELTEATARVQQVKMESQEARVRLKTIDEQLAESGVDRAELMPQIPHEATVESWQTRIEELERRIQRLGPINLAAIEEYREQVQRKEYLDEQHEDITQALETLEEAIRKIDRETKALFRETFDIVNSKLQELFPRLFGGGQAMLELTGDDLLDTGVAVMARPPGKRVSSIHLLSGGEKAMTAVALVFAFFHLRPSPFCMLDEVDAPLDDANVGRFAKMVSEMSSQVQFIFITHNKATMEMSTHLMGVTMQEPGVSRLVAVDVDEAVELAVA